MNLNNLTLTKQYWIYISMADFVYMLMDNLTYNLEKSRKALHLIGNLIS